jgi:hypothetical protein
MIMTFLYERQLPLLTQYLCHVYEIRYEHASFSKMLLEVNDIV